MEFVSLRPGALPDYLGSTLRGAFGHSLKRLVCVDRNLECPTCPHRLSCIYIKLFEPIHPKTGRDIPVGFILRPITHGGKSIESSSRLTLAITLLGPIRDYLPYVVYLFRDMGKRGFGRERIPFRLIQIAELDEDENLQMVYEDGDESIVPSRFPFLLLSERFSQHHAGSEDGHQPLALNFHTPCRLKIDRHLRECPSFHDIARTLFRRLSALDHFYGDKSLDLHYDSWLDLAKQVRTVSSDLQWSDWERYSNRQATKMKLGGFIGRIVFEGPIEPFLPFLRAGEITHLGKNAGFGLGRYTLEDGYES